MTQKRESPRLVNAIREGTVDWLTFASPSSVDGFFEHVPADVVVSGGIKVASIGPVTSARLKQLGVKVDVTAEEHTLDGLLNAVENVERR